MGLHLLLGGAGTGKSSRCYEDIVNHVTSAADAKAWLIVPDQDVFPAERALAERFPAGGFTRAVVCGFSGLAHQVFRELRMPYPRVPSPAGAGLILRRVLREQAGNLRFFGDTAVVPRFAEDLLALFQSMDRYGATEEALRKAAARVAATHRELADKLHDVVLLHHEYADMLEQRGLACGGVMARLAEVLGKSPFIRSSRIWIDGFHTLPPHLLSLVKVLVDTAEEVTVTLPLTEEAAPYLSRPAALYRELEAMHPVETVRLHAPVRFHNAALSGIATGFFSFPGKSCTASPDEKQAGLHLTAAATRREEAEAIAREIKTLARRGMRYRDMLVLPRKLDSYADALEEAFATYGIPYFLNRQKSLSSHPLVRFVRGLLRFLSLEEQKGRTGYERTLVFSLLKTGLFESGRKKDGDNRGALTHPHIAKLENYVLRYGIGPKEWHETWTSRDIRDLDGPPTAPSVTEQARLDSINALRATVVERLDALTAAWKKAGTVAEKCAVLYRWLTRVNKIPTKLGHWDEARPDGFYFQTWTKFLDLLDDLVADMGEEPAADKDLAAVLDRALASLTRPTPPRPLDGVTVSGLIRGYNLSGRVVFLPGLLTGEFPKRMEPAGLFSTEETDVLEGEGLRVGQSLADLGAEEGCYTYLAFTRASEALYLSYPTVTDDAREGTPSPLITSLQHLGYLGKADPVMDKPYFDNPEQALAALPLAAALLPDDHSEWTGLRDWAKRNRPDLYQRHIRGFYYENTTVPLPAARLDELLLHGKPLTTSISSLQTYRGCPYRYFLDQGLRLEERKTGRFQSNDFGSYIHAGLHLFGDYLARQGKDWKDATDDEIDRETRRLMKDVAARLRGGLFTRTGAGRHTLKLLDLTLRETIRVLREWNGQSSFHTADREKAFQFTLPNSSWQIRGKIDRVDRWQDFVTIWDYKTGKESASLDELRLGIKLQLPTYFLALKAEDPSVSPAALLYLHILPGRLIRVKDKDIQDMSGPTPRLARSTQNITGYYLEDKAAWEALDNKAGTGDAYIVAVFKKDGTPNLQKKNSHLDPAQMEKLVSITAGHLAAFCGAISQGGFPIRPYLYLNSDGCTYCPYHSICRFDPENPGEDYDTLTPMKADEVLALLKQP